MASRRSPTAGRRLSVEEFQALPEREAYRLELVRGRVVHEPAPAPRHGRLSAEISIELGNFLRARPLGVLLVNTGFVLAADPPTIRAPDVAVVAPDRIPGDGYDAGFWRMAPDLAIEILSPSNTYAEVQDRVADYLDGGGRLVWVVEPRRRTVTVYRSRTDVRILREGEELDGGDVLPGFRLSLEALFRL